MIVVRDGRDGRAGQASAGERGVARVERECVGGITIRDRAPNRMSATPGGPLTQHVGARPGGNGSQKKSYAPHGAHIVDSS